jgi:hypothetical protein
MDEPSPIRDATQPGRAGPGGPGPSTRFVLLAGGAAALLWVCENRLRAGMSKEEVERVLGEALPGQLSTLGPVVAGPPGSTVKSEEFDTRGFGGLGPRVSLSFREGLYLGHRYEQQPLGRY